MNTKRTHIVIPRQLVARIDIIVGKRGRSKFLTQAAEKELMRLRQLKAIEAAAQFDLPLLVRSLNENANVSRIAATIPGTTWTDSVSSLAVAP